MPGQYAFIDAPTCDSPIWTLTNHLGSLKPKTIVLAGPVDYNPRERQGSMTRGASLVAILLTLATNSRAATDTPTFTKDVAPIVYNSCATCHRPGEVAPMSLITFQD